MTIGLNIKQQCIELSRQGKTAREIFNEYYLPQFPGSNFDTFARAMRKWKQKCLADEDTLQAGTYPDFKVNAATVQVDRNGVVTQAWIKQKATNEISLEDISEVLKDVAPADIEPVIWEDSRGLLEIQPVDMHLGIADINHYKPVFADIIGVVQKQHWDKIVITIGNDLFHNDNFKGETKSGRQIEKVKMKSAYKWALELFYALIDTAIKSANEISVIYIPGNHSSTAEWYFCQTLKARYGNIIDDSDGQRKAVFWKECFIGLTHGDFKKNKPSDIRSQFSVKFPMGFAYAKIKEVHMAHLHHEKEEDDYGVMCRRLSTANVEDEWSDDEGFIGANKRFMLFEWEPGKLKSIHYVYA